MMIKEGDAQRLGRSRKYRLSCSGSDAHRCFASLTAHRVGGRSTSKRKIWGRDATNVVAPFARDRWKCALSAIECSVACRNSVRYNFCPIHRKSTQRGKRNTRSTYKRSKALLSFARWSLARLVADSVQQQVPDA